MGPDDAATPLSVSVAYSPRAGEVDEVKLVLARGATVADALHASGLVERHPGVAIDVLPVGVWGSFCDRAAPLHDGDRVELYRPLQVDPKEARRLRYRASPKPARVKGG